MMNHKPQKIVNLQSTILNREVWLIGLLFIIMLLKGALWSMAFPLWQGPDEEDHYAVIQYIAEIGSLPGREDTFLLDEIAQSRELADVGRLPYNPEQRQGFAPSTDLGQTPLGPNEAAFAELPAETRDSVALGFVGKLNKATPLYYIMAVPIYQWSSAGDLLWRAQVQRLWAVLLGSPIVIVAYLISRVLFPTSEAMRLTIPTLVAFHPMITEITAVISVDGFYFVCYSLLIYFCLRAFRDGFDHWKGIAIGVTFAVGVLVKPTLNGFAPLVALMVFVQAWRQRDAFWEVVKTAVLMNVIIIIPVGWWMFRSLRINDDPFYFNPVLEGHRIINNPFYDYQPLQHAIDFYQSIWGGFFVTWWAHFGWLDTPLPPWVYSGLRGLTVLAMVGLLVGLLRWKAGGFVDWQVGKGIAPLGVWLFLALTLIVPAVLLQVYDLTFWWEYGNGRGMQGRYWLGTVVPMLTFFVGGLLLLVPGESEKGKTAVHLALRTGMILFNFVSLLGYILPRFYL